MRLVRFVSYIVCALIALSFAGLVYVTFGGYEKTSEIKIEDMREYRLGARYVSLESDKLLLMKLTPSFQNIVFDSDSVEVEEFPDILLFRNTQKLLESAEPGVLVNRPVSIFLNKPAYDSVLANSGGSFVIKYRVVFGGLALKVVVGLLLIYSLILILISKTWRERLARPSTRLMVIVVVGSWLLVPLAYGVWVFSIDPIQRFSYDLEKPQIYPNNQVLRVAGAIYSHNYDGVLLGASISQNAKAVDFENAFGGQAVNFTISGSTVVDQAKVAKAALREKPVKTLLWELHLTSFSQPDGQTNQAFEPYYLMDKDPFNDLQYWMSTQSLRDAKIKLQRMGAASEMRLFDETMKWQKVFDNKIMYEKVCKTQDFSTFSLDSSQVPLNIEKYVLPLVKENPETEFLFFVPPYSSSYYSGGYNAESVVNAVEVARKALAGFANVRFTSFVSDEEVINDVSNYRDDLHFHPRINTRIINVLAGKELYEEPNSSDSLTIMENGAKNFAKNVREYCEAK